MSSKLKKKVSKTGITLNLFALSCWIIMFLAGTDAWHDTGSHDFWNLQGPPYNDLRSFTYAFYLLFLILVANLIMQFIGLRKCTGLKTGD